MFSDLSTIREAVKARLAPILPSGWESVEFLEGTVKSRTPVWYIEFVRVDSAIQGGALGRGQVAAVFNIIITDPKTDTKKAENAVDGHLLALLGAVDEFDDIFWDNAEKKRLLDGPMAWTVSAFALALIRQPTKGA